METFAEPSDLVENPRYAQDRESVVSSLDLKTVDEPIVDIIRGFSNLPMCFTLQSCYGHFVHATQPDPENLSPVPTDDIGSVRYRIAYIALCIERSDLGQRLLGKLGAIPAIDRQYIQFGSPEWFLEQYPNSYALQVEPDRFKCNDEAVIDHSEALHVQSVRDEFFNRLRALLYVDLNEAV